MEMFRNNEFPQILFKSGEEPVHVFKKDEMERLTRDGWSRSHVPQPYPRWVLTGRKIRMNPITGRPALPKDGIDEKTGALLFECPEVEERVLCHTPEEEAKLRPQAQAQPQADPEPDLVGVDEAVEVKPRRGRPPKVQEPV